MCRLTFDLLRQDQVCALKHLYVENVEKLLSQNVLKTNGWNLQHVVKEVKLFSYPQNFGCYLPLPVGYVQV